MGCQRCLHAESKPLDGHGAGTKGHTRSRPLNDCLKQTVHCPKTAHGQQNPPLSDATPISVFIEQKLSNWTPHTLIKVMYQIIHSTIRPNQLWSLHYDDSALGRLLDHYSIALSAGWVTQAALAAMRCILACCSQVCGACTIAKRPQ
jgi:hypothetical protein